jgi:hypothetical protein
MKRIITATLLITLWANVLGASAMAATPEPTYTTLKTEGNFAVRAYAPQLAADVMLVGEDASMNRAFRILANYIFKEYPSGKIGMTAPVTVQETQSIGMTAPVTVKAEENRVFMRFFLPERYTLKTLPKPEDKRITIVELPARKVAVVQFNWFLSDAAIEKNTTRLLAWMKENKLIEAGAPETQGYNPPWTLPWWRRNEIWIPLAS